MNIHRTLDLSTTVQESLQKLTATDQTASLLDIYERCELRIRDLVWQATVAEIELLAKKNNKSLEPGNGLFRYGNSYYELRVGNYDTKPDSLIIIIKCTDPSASKFLNIPITIGFNSVGIYKKIEVYNEDLFKSVSGQIAEAAKLVLEVGYRFLLEHIRISLSDIHDVTTALEINSWVRRHLPEQIANNVWPYSITDGEGTYILDAIAQTTALTNLTKRNINSSLSPLEMLIHFSTSRVPSEQTFTNVALNQNSTIQREFVKARYEPHLQLAEQAIYLSPALTIQPIVCEGRTQLAVGYPPSLQREIKPRLEIGRKEINGIIEAQSSSLRRTARSLNGHSIPSNISIAERLAAGCGAVGGTFLKHFLENYFHH